MRLSLLILLVSLGSCGLTRHAEVVARVALVDEARLRQHVCALCAIGPRPEGDNAATAATLEYLAHELSSYGYTPEREEFVAVARVWHRRVAEDGEVTFLLTSKRGPSHNLFVEKRGTETPESVIEIGAHYDSVVFGPGANDNASGVAAVLEIARLVAGVPTRKTIRVIFFAMEEEGLVGSREHVERLVREDCRPEGLLCLDGIGFATDEPDSQSTPVRIPWLFSPPTVGNFVLVAGDSSSGWLGNLHEACIETYVRDLPYYSLNRLAGWFEDSRRGDHFNYWRAGIPSIALVDGMEYRNPHYHKKTDTPGTLNFTFLHRNTQAALATMLHWAGLEDQAPRS